MSLLNKCKHCHQLYPALGDSEFCCKGCESIYNFIQDSGYSDVYDLRNGRILPPDLYTGEVRINSRLIEELIILSEQPDGTYVLTIPFLSELDRLQVHLLEKMFMPIPGAVSIEVDVAVKQIRLEWTGKDFNLEHFIREFSHMGLRVSLAGVDVVHKNKIHFFIVFLLCALISAILLFVGLYLNDDSSFIYFCVAIFTAMLSILSFVGYRAPS